MRLRNLKTLIFGFQAADLLKHPHLRPYILNIHLKSDIPRHHTFPVQSSDANNVKKTRFMEPKAVPMLTDRDKKENRRSFGNNRALNPSISGNELDSPRSSPRTRNFSSHLNRSFSELSIASVNEFTGVKKSATTKLSSAIKSPRVNSAKASAPARKQITPSKLSNCGSTRELVRYIKFIQLVLSFNTGPWKKQ